MPISRPITVHVSFNYYYFQIIWILIILTPWTRGVHDWSVEYMYSRFIVPCGDYYCLHPLKKTKGSSTHRLRQNRTSDERKALMAGCTALFSNLISFFVFSIQIKKRGTKNKENSSRTSSAVADLNTTLRPTVIEYNSTNSLGKYL